MGFLDRFKRKPALDEVPLPFDEVPLPDDNEIMQLAVSQLKPLEGQAASADLSYGVAINRPEFHRILLVFGKKTILTSDLRLVDGELNKLMDETQQLGEFNNLLQLTIDGYGSDRRNLWEIPEVTAYFWVLHSKRGFLPVWLGKESLPLYFAMTSKGVPLTQFVRITEALDFSKKACEILAERAFPTDQKAAQQMAEHLHKVASARIMKAMPL